MPELVPEFLELLTLFLEINFSAAFIEKVRLDNKPPMVPLWKTIAARTLAKVQKVRTGVQSFDCPLGASMAQWCDVAEVYF